MIEAIRTLGKKSQMRKHNYITEKDLQAALAQADREFSDGSAKVYEDTGQLFREAGWIDESGLWIKIKQIF